MKPIKIDGPLLKTLIEAQLIGGMTDLQDRWPRKGGLSRATIYRWQKGGLPQSSEDLLHLCAILDVDPFAILTHNERDLTSSINMLLAAFYNDLWTPALSFMKEFLGRRADWPPQSIAQAYYQRNWITFDFDHSATPEHSMYALLELTAARPEHPSLPNVCHFAYRQEHLYGARWLHYGFVQQTALDVRLVHINGHFQDYRKYSMQSPALVETFFGPSPTRFRVASLHPFSIRRVHDSNPTMPRVRFPL